jgi:hypothetical protein
LIPFGIISVAKGNPTTSATHDRENIRVSASPKKAAFELNVSYLVNKVTDHLENSGLIGGEPLNGA